MSENESSELDKLEEIYDEIYPMACVKVQSNEAYRYASYGLMRALPLLRDDIFWSIVETFRTELTRKRQGKYGYIVEHAIQNTCCKLNWKEHSNVLPIEMCEDQGIGFATMILMFSKTWRQKGLKVASKIDGEEKTHHRGDDSWGDYLDSIPLLGEQLYNDIMKGEYPARRENELRADAKSIMTVKFAELYTDKRTAKINHQQLTDVVDHVIRSIFEGENYFASEIEEKGLKRLAHACWIKHTENNASE